MTTNTILAQLDSLTERALRYRCEAYEARELGYDDDAAGCFLDAADLIQEAGALAGAHGLEMPARLDGDHALVDLFQAAAIEAYSDAHPGRLH